ncbi:MAG: glycosidase [Planctomycetota bacterium]
MRYDLFTRDPGNPLITARDLPYQANAVFNAGAADLGDQVVLLVRVETTSGRSHLIVARSKDGFANWQFEDRALLHPAQGFPYETNGVEDCRITWLAEKDCWGIAYTAYSDHGPGVALATTTDFETAERIGMVLPPDDKNAALFPRTFDGLYAMLHRPSVGGGSVWISYSPDLVYWGKPDVVIPARGGPWWDGVRVGAGLSPIETDAGWLVIYHGVKDVVGNPIYRLGAALLDRDEPHRLIGRARRWLLSPQEPYERTGDAPNVVFTSGGFVRGDDLWVYYGAADSCICLATAKLADVLAAVTNEPQD